MEKSSSKNNTCKEEVFNELFRNHSEDLYKFLYYKYGADNNPSDLVQEAFIKLWNNCAKVLPEKARAFLFTVANHQMLNELSKKSTALKHATSKPRDFTSEDPEFVLREKEFKKKLEQALSELTESQRIAFMLSKVEGKKHREIAEMLGISQKAVEKRIYGAIALLKEKIDIF